MAVTRDQLTQLYREELGRDPNFGVAGGADYWINESGLSNPEDIRSAIKQSQEYQTVQNVKSWFEQNPGATDTNIAGAMQQYNVSPEIVSQATGVLPDEVRRRAQAATPIPVQPASTDTFPPITVGGGNVPTVSLPLDAGTGGGSSGVTGVQTGSVPGVTVGLPDTVADPFSAFSAEQANQIYMEELGRPLGEEGLNYWLNDPTVRQNIRDLDTLRATIRQSEEAQQFQQTGTPSTAFTPLDQFPVPYQPVQPSAIQGELDAIYRDILGPTRGVGQEGLQTWTGDYNRYRQAGDTHAQALVKIRQSVQDSEEAKAFDQAKQTAIPFLQKFYTDYLGRQLGSQGQEYWTSEFLRLVAEGNPESQALQMIEGMIAESEEAKIYANTGVASEVVDPVGEMPPSTDPMIANQMTQRATAPAVPVGGAMQPAQIGEATTQQIIGTGVGQVGAAPQATMQTAGTTAQAMAPTMQPAAQVTAQDATPNVSDALQQVAPAQGSVSTNAQVQAAQMSPTATEVGTVGAAQIAEAQQVQQPQSRTLQEGELVTAAANAQQAAAFAEQVGAATADPTSKATVQGQLADLMTQFEGGEIPAWAAGAMRQANATLAARGLGASSIAGQAVVQAAMEASLPIASADAATVAQFELTNLSNRQQRAMLAAQQRAQFIGQEFDQQFQARVSNAARIADIANLNFNAEQQVALENARLAQSVDLANLQNTQALVMAEASQIANLETANLNNRQQAAVQNAQAFLQMDLTNLSNQQQTDMFKAQSLVQSLLSDQAAENASRQFNASSENQTNQFFANLNAQISQYNATQNNAMSQFNAEQSNVVNRFNAELQAQRDQFNAQNQLVIEQSNAQWRRELATADTAAQNLANQFNAQAILEISNTAYAQLWQSYRDDMEFAWTSGENERDRLAQLALQKLQVDASKYAADAKEDGSFASALGSFAATVVSTW